MTTAECLKNLRKKLLLTQTEFAKELGITFSSVNNYEHGKRNPSYATIRKIIALAKKAQY